MKKREVICHDRPGDTPEDNPFKEKTFKELFPSLKPFDIDCRDISINNKRDTISIVEEAMNRMGEVIKEQIKEHLLDKKRVKKVINDNLYGLGMPETRKWILKQLGLDDEQQKIHRPDVKRD